MPRSGFPLRSSRQTARPSSQPRARSTRDTQAPARLHSSPSGSQIRFHTGHTRIHREAFLVTSFLWRIGVRVRGFFRFLDRATPVFPATGRVGNPSRGYPETRQDHELKKEIDGQKAANHEHVLTHTDPAGRNASRRLSIPACLAEIRLSKESHTVSQITKTEGSAMR